MAVFRVDYITGTYEQSDLSPRKRIPDDLVADFIRYWMQGRNPAWIGSQIISPRGVALTALMVRSHARRLEEQGHIKAPNGYMQPSWRDWKRTDTGARIGVVNADPRAAHRVRVESMVGGTVSVNRGGRPPRGSGIVEVTAAPDPWPGKSWQEKARLREEAEEAERQAAREGRKNDPA